MGMGFIFVRLFYITWNLYEKKIERSLSITVLIQTDYGWDRVVGGEAWVWLRYYLEIK